MFPVNHPGFSWNRKACFYKTLWGYISLTWANNNNQAVLSKLPPWTSRDTRCIYPTTLKSITSPTLFPRARRVLFYYMEDSKLTKRESICWWLSCCQPCRTKHLNANKQKHKQNCEDMNQLSGWWKRRDGCRIGPRTSTNASLASQKWHLLVDYWGLMIGSAAAATQSLRACRSVFKPVWEIVTRSWKTCSP